MLNSPHSLRVRSIAIPDIDGQPALVDVRITGTESRSHDHLPSNQGCRSHLIDGRNPATPQEAP